MPIMMWLFQSVINGLVTIGQGNYTAPPNWYIYQTNIFLKYFILTLVILIHRLVVIHIQQLKVLLNGMQR